MARPRSFVSQTQIKLIHLSLVLIMRCYITLEIARKMSLFDT